MYFALLRAFSVSFGFLLTMLPRTIACHGISSQNFVVPEAWRNYCPDSENATGTCYAKSMIKCAAECILHQGCICLSYYATTRLCYIYNLAPQKKFYDHDCTFMMVSFLYNLSACSSNALHPSLLSAIIRHTSISRATVQNNYGLSCIPLLCPREWNRLPLFLRTTNSLPSFKQWPKTHHFFLAFKELES